MVYLLYLLDLDRFKPLNHTQFRFLLHGRFIVYLREVLKLFYRFLISLLLITYLLNLLLVAFRHFKVFNQFLFRFLGFWYDSTLLPLMVSQERLQSFLDVFKRALRSFQRLEDLLLRFLYFNVNWNLGILELLGQLVSLRRTKRGLITRA